MIALSPIEITSNGQCTGLVITDTTDYDQSKDATIDGFLNVFRLENFEAGLRLVGVLDPQGNRYLFCSTEFVNKIPFTPQIYVYPTQITSSNNTTYSQTFYSIIQGEFTISIISIPSILDVTDTVTQTNFKQFDLTCFNFGGDYQIYVAIVNNPTQDIYDESQWTYVQITNNPSGTPPPFLNEATFTQDCFQSNLECVLKNTECAFCCGCCDDDIFSNHNSVRAIKASLLSLELSLLANQITSEQFSNFEFFLGPGFRQTKPLYVQFIVPTDSYLNKVCNYSKVISTLCNCNPLKECKPCDTSSASDPSQLITQQEITNALNGIFADGFVRNLNKQVMLGKKLSNKSRKQLVALIVSMAYSNANIEVTAPNYNCINSIIDLTTSDTSSSVLLSSNGSELGNNNGNPIGYDKET